MNMPQQGNPLAKYFRQPGIHISLPSNGKYNNQGDVVLGMTGEVGILPMTAADEIIINNPDSLLNGAAIEKIVGSCCPEIKNPRMLPITDVDAVVLAIKLVTYGEGLEMTCVCPKCNTPTDVSLSIRDLLFQAKHLPVDHTIRANDEMVMYLRPHTLSSNTKINLATFEETKMLQNLTAEGVEESDRIKAFTDSFERITKLNLSLLSECIIKVVTPAGEVTDGAMISEFIRNAPRDLVKKIQEGVKFLNGHGLPKTVDVSCANDKCKNTWSTNIVYDPSSFFASNS